MPTIDTNVIAAVTTLTAVAAAATTTSTSVTSPSAEETAFMQQSREEVGDIRVCVEQHETALCHNMTDSQKGKVILEFKDKVGID